MRKKPPLEKLKEASGHLAYEFWMFEACLEWLRINWGKCEHPDCVRFAFLEAFCIHTRNLTTFFYNEESERYGYDYDGKGGGDVLAQHFFDGSEKKWRPPPKSELLAEVEKQVHKRVAHLTFTRTHEDYSWRWIEIHREITAIMKHFLEEVPGRSNKIDRRLCSWYERHN